MSATKTPKSARKNNTAAVDEALAPSSERVLKKVQELYQHGLATSLDASIPGPASLGLVGVAQATELSLRKPRKKLTVMIVGNHSAGKSSFINWYIDEHIQRTGVAIETRGFTFITSGRKRETLTGEATMRYFDFLQGFDKFPGILPNLFTEISTSKEKNFSAADFVDTPGLVDGDMLYPFDVEEAIVWMAEHVDLILIFFDPIGQATCKRTMQVVERLNNGPHLEKIHYFMSKADAVEKENDRQRVLIQITQNLATKIRNSHAFSLPTFYLPKPDGPPCSIPNAIEEVCREIDQSLNMTVQKNLRNLKVDCTRVVDHIDGLLVQDKVTKGANMQRRLQGLLLVLLALATAALLGAIVFTRVLPSLCSVSGDLCTTSHGAFLVKLQPAVREHFNLVAGSTLVVLVGLSIAAKLTWRIAKVFSKKDMRRMGEYKTLVDQIAGQEKGLYEEYFMSLSHADQR